jgi:cytochrome c-type biogenesis protein CcmH/NrfG
MLTNVKLVVVTIFVAILLATGAYFHRATLEAGKQQARLECMEQRDKEAELARNKIAELEQDLQQINLASQQRQKDLNKHIKQITNKLKNQPVAVIEGGRCVPAVIFTDTINEAINKVNAQ